MAHAPVELPDCGGAGRHRYTALAVLVLIALATVPYIQTVLPHFELLNWDDDHYIAKNELIRALDWAHLQRMFTGYHFTDYMPLNLLLLAVDYATWGHEERPADLASLPAEQQARWGPDETVKVVPWRYHLTNVVLHTLNAVLVFLLCRLILRHEWLAFIAAAVFTVHPVQVETVAWATERKSLLSGAMLLGSLILYIKYERRGSQRLPWPWYLPPVALALVGALGYWIGLTRATREPLVPTLTQWLFGAAYLYVAVLCAYAAITRRSGGGYAGALVLAALGPFAKPVTIVLFVLLYLYMVCYESKWWPGSVVDKLPFVAVCIVGAVVGHSAQTNAGTVLPWHGDSRWNNAVTMLPIWPDYLKNLACPLNLTAVYHPAVFSGLSPGSPSVWLAASLVGLLVLVGATVAVRLLWRRFEVAGLLVVMLGLYVGAQAIRQVQLKLEVSSIPWQRYEAINIVIGVAILLALGRLAVLCWFQWRRAFFWVAWVPVHLVLVSNLFAPMNTLMADRYLYLPCLAFGALLALSIERPLKGTFRGLPSGLGRGAAVGCVGTLLVMLAAMSWARTHVWQDTFSLWSDTITKEYRGPIIRNQLGWAYYEKWEQDQRQWQLLRKAQSQLVQSVAMDGRYFHSHFGLGMVYKFMGLYEEAARELEAAVPLDRERADVCFYLATVYGELRQPEKVREALEEAIRRKPDYVEALHNLGTYHDGRKDFVTAIDYYQRAIDADPNRELSYVALARDLHRLNRVPDAADAYRRYLNVAPRGRFAPEAAAYLRMLGEGP